MSKQKLTCTFYIGGKQVEKLTEEQLDRMAQRLSERMSLYYTAHPEEYAVILANDKKAEIKNNDKANNEPQGAGDISREIHRRL